jgi:peptidoglycan/LPS O-acetylase OafA/YrhL
VSPAPPGERVVALDGLRGLAALVVVLHHCLLALPPLADPYRSGRPPAEGVWAWLVYSPLHVLWQGPAAVYLFFVLSGYVLTLPALRASFCWSAYLPSRLVRLYLPTAAAVLLAVLVYALVPHEARPGASWWVNRHDLDVTPAWVAKDMLLVLGTNSLNSPLWSLRWEVLFSLLLPLFVFLARRVGRAWPVALVGLLVLCWVGGRTSGHGGALYYLPMFALGAVLAAQRRLVGPWWERRVGGRRTGRVLLVVGVLLLSTHWMMIGVGVTTSWVRTAGVVLELAGALLLVMTAIWSPAACRPLEHPVARWLGSRSFSLYLVHEPLAVAISMLLPLDDQLLTPLLTVPLALLVAEGFFRLVERPSHRLARGVSRRTTAAIVPGPARALWPAS